MIYYQTFDNDYYLASTYEVDTDNEDEANSIFMNKMSKEYNIPKNDDIYRFLESLYNLRNITASRTFIERI